VFASILFGQTASMPDTVAFADGSVSIPVIITDVVELEGIDLTLQYDETVLTAISTSFENTALDGMNYTGTTGLDNSGEIMVIAYAGGSLFTGSGTFLFINFDVIGQLSESTDLTFTSIEINNISILENSENGSVTVHQVGCMDVDACNYDESATYDNGSYCLDLDCFGECGGTSWLNNCSECVEDSDVSCVQSCDGNWTNDGSELLDDECGICGGDNSSCTGCMDDTACNYSLTATISGECEYPEENYDCSGNCNVEIDCLGTCGSSLVDDVCGVCGGDNSSCTGCMDDTACNYSLTAMVTVMLKSIVPEYVVEVP
jgi:hypothetical protein